MSAKPASETKYAQVWRSVLLLPIVSVGAILVCAGILYTVRTVSQTASQAERTLHCMNTTQCLLIRYVANNDGKWPESWNDLKEVRLSEEETSSIIQWPRDAVEIQNSVTIDFDLDVRELAQSRADDFVAISPRKVCYKQGTNWAILVVLQVENGYSQPAIEELTKTIAHHPSHRWARKWRGIAYFREGQYSDSVTDFDIYLEANRDDTEVLAMRESAIERGREAE